MSTPQFFPNPYPAAPCDMFSCSTRAKWLVGRPDGPSLVMPGFLRLCDECAKKVIKNLPDELLPHLPKKPDVQQLVDRRAHEISDNLLQEFVFVLESGDHQYCHEVAQKFKAIMGAEDPVAEVQKLKPKPKGAKK